MRGLDDSVKSSHIFGEIQVQLMKIEMYTKYIICLLYTSDAADE